MRRPYLLKKRGDVWYYRLSTEKTFHTTKKKTRARAEAYVLRLLGQEADGVRRRDLRTLREFADGFFDPAGDWVRRRLRRGGSFSPAMSRMRNGHLKKYVLKEFGDRYLDQVRMHELEDWLLELELSAGSINHIRHTLNIVFQEAKRQGLVKENPVADIEPLPSNYSERGTFTLDELGKLFPPEWDKLIGVWKAPLWAVMHYLMLTTGMRVGEAGALLWRHVVWDKRGILIVQAVKADGTIGPPKSGKPRAALIPERAYDLLERWYRMTPYPGSEHYVFFGRDGKHHLNTKTISRRMAGAIKQAKIKPAGRILVAHSLRHTYNTRMEQLLPDAILRYMVGHGSQKMTERYTHVTPEERLLELAKNREAVDGAWN